MRIVMWGTFDTGKPRTRILRAALREGGVEVLAVHADIWRGIEDKSQVSGLRSRLRFLLSWLAAYPRLVWRYLRAPAHDAVIVGYLGHLDVLVLWPFARLRGKAIVWDAFLSLYDTVVLDRKLVGPRHPLAWFLWGWEWLACRAATRVVLDTAAHARLFRETYHLPPARTAAVFVGAETDVFHRPPAGHPQAADETSSGTETTILFYGQFIPLHGIETIIKAAQLSRQRPFRWVVVGRGQEEANIQALVDRCALPRLDWIPWIPYEELPKRLAEADVCLGIFGNTEKASRVIPNKVFQILSAGRPLITRDSPAIRELLSDAVPGVYLIPPDNPEALVDAVERFRAESSRTATAGESSREAVLDKFALPTLAAAWRTILDNAVDAKRQP